MIHIVYFSNVTENTHRFISKLNWGSITRIPVKGDFEGELPQSFVLICPSYGSKSSGHIPPQVKKFLSNPENREKCVGVIGTGNRNFGEEYAMAADVIAEKLKIPTLYRLELSGTTADVEKVKEGLNFFEKYLKQNKLIQNK